MSFQILQLNDQSVSIAIIDKNIELSYEDALIKKTMDDANEKTLWSQSGKLIFYNIEDSNNLINKKSVKIKIFEINDQTFTYRNMLMLPFKINAKCYVNISFYDEEKNKLKIKILNQDYEITCNAGDENDLIKSSELLNEKMSEIKNSGKTIGIDRIAIITALNFAKEIISLKENSVQLTEDSAQKIESIQNKLDLIVNIE